MGSVKRVSATLLSTIQKENDIKKIAPEDYRRLAKEIRVRLVKGISRTGGHLASNLGAVELTMALHLFLEFPKDKLIWDVGHQSYVHKILTGRNARMKTLRKLDGISGFPKVEENPADTFNTGHSSTSISVALGMAKARDIRGGDEKVVAVIGDGAMTGGMAFEALNNAEQLKSNIIIVLNDNKMSIAKNVGGMSHILGKMRTNEKYNSLKRNIEERLDEIPNVGISMAENIKNIKNSLKHFLVPGMFFEEMGIIYIGPIDGHNIESMISAFQAAARIQNRPVLVHVVTKKGKGYLPAENNPSAFHGVGIFDPRTGEIPEEPKNTYTDIFGRWLVEKGRQCPELVSVCAAMPDGTGVRAFAEEFPQRAFDVGIAEEHAVTFAAGLVSGGLRPVISLYSTFMQRAYDQMIHDVCLNRLPVIFTVDRSGIVGRDGDTHQGIFDLSYLTSMPNMTVMSPMDGTELEMCLDFACECDGPVAVRYPRGEAYDWEHRGGRHLPLELGKASIIVQKGRPVTEEIVESTGEDENADIVIFAVGNMVSTAVEVSEKLREKGVSTTVVNMRFAKPLDEELVIRLAPRHKIAVSMEDNVRTGGIGQQMEALMIDNGVIPRAFVNISIPDCFVKHGQPEELYQRLGMDAEGVAHRIMEKWEEEL